MTDGVTITIGASVVSAIAGAAATYWKTRQTQRTASRIEPQPLAVKLEEQFADRAGNASDHSDIFGRLARLERDGGEMRGTLASIRDDVLIVKNILMGAKNK